MVIARLGGDAREPDGGYLVAFGAQQAVEGATRAQLGEQPPQEAHRIQPRCAALTSMPIRKWRPNSSWVLRPPPMESAVGLLMAVRRSTHPWRVRRRRTVINRRQMRLHAISQRQRSRCCTRSKRARKRPRSAKRQLWNGAGRSTRRVRTTSFRRSWLALSAESEKGSAQRWSAA